MKKIKLRKFKKYYVQKLWEKLETYKQDNDPQIFDDIDLESTDTTEIISEITIDMEREFESRFYLGKYVYEIVSKAFGIKNNKFEYLEDPGFWTWLSFLYFDQLTKNKTLIRRMEHYIPDLGEFKGRLEPRSLAYRHSVREHFKIYSQFGEEGKIYYLSSTKIFEQGNIIESIRSRKHCLNHPEIHRYLVLKYSLPSGFARMSTATTPNPKSGTGIDSTLRLAKIYKRLNLTYIGLLLTAEELADTIGPGFELEE